MGSSALAKIIEVDSAKCVNCHACISACPVKYCNDGSGDYVTVNQDMCIGCGKCIEACTHEARNYIDDFKIFLSDVISGQKIIAIVSPAVAASFPNNFLKVNTFFKEIGIDAVFDVSFGAELTVKSYLDVMDNDDVKTVIAQPCAAIVTYIELYQPELIKYLAPVDSPMLHTIKMVKTFFPEFKNHKVAVLSPCNAKKREFIETGLGDYNIAIQSLANFLKESNTDIDALPETDFDNPPAERAVLFSTPGGLLRTVERWVPEIVDKTRKIEGTPNIYNYLRTLPNMIHQGKAPLLIDCLSCEFGCNAGPLTATKHLPQDEIEHRVNARSLLLKQKYLAENGNDVTKTRYTIENLISRFWKEDLYNRTYVNRWENVNLSYPNPDELKAIYEQMHKYSESDIKNCTSCGYNSCQGMATAIHNNLNRAENCHFYMSEETKLANISTKQTSRKLSNILETSLDGFVEMNKQGLILNANNAFKKLLKKNDILGRSIYEFVSGDPKDYKAKLLQGSLEMQLKQSDGNKVCCLVSASALYNEGVLKGSFAMISDISKLKKAELQLREANEGLEQKVKDRTNDLKEAYEEVLQRNEEISQQREEIEAQRDALFDSEQRIKFILESMPDAAFIINENSVVTFWNHGMEELTGISASKMVGKGNYEYALPFYGERRPILVDFAMMFKEKVAEDYPHIRFENDILQAEISLKNLNGNVRHVVGRATALHDSDGRPSGAIEIIHDITERHNILKKVEAQKHDITSSIQYAARIQDAILPSVQHIQSLISESFVYYKPKDIVSGDFYWIKEIDKKIIIAVADCTGHGVPGAFMSMLGNTFLNEIVIKNHTTRPDLILNKLRDGIKGALRQNSEIGQPSDGMDMAILVYEPGTNFIEYSGANNSMYIFRNSELIECKADAMPVGLHRMDYVAFKNNTIEIQNDDVFYMFSDGYRDQTGGEHARKFMTKRFKDILLEIHKLPMSEQCKNLKECHETWRGQREQIDDILVMGFKL